MTKSNNETLKPANFTFDQIEVGQNVSFKREITQPDVEDFAKLTGDYNPLHVSDDFAAKSKFGKRVVHGLLVQSFLSTLAGMYLPGKNSLILEVKSQFKKPVFIGESLQITGKVVKKQEVGKLIFIDAQIANSSGEIVIVSQMTVGVLQ